MAFKYIPHFLCFIYLSFEVLFIYLFIYLLFMSLCEVTMSPYLFLRTAEI